MRQHTTQRLIIGWRIRYMGRWDYFCLPCMDTITAKRKRGFAPVRPHADHDYPCCACDNRLEQTARLIARGVSA